MNNQGIKRLKYLNNSEINIPYSPLLNSISGVVISEWLRVKNLMLIWFHY